MRSSKPGDRPDPDPSPLDRVRRHPYLLAAALLLALVLFTPVVDFHGETKAVHLENDAEETQRFEATLQVQEGDETGYRDRATVETTLSSGETAAVGTIARTGSYRLEATGDAGATCTYTGSVTFQDDGDITSTASGRNDGCTGEIEDGGAALDVNVGFADVRLG